MDVIIDCSGMDTRLQLHQELAKQLSFPGWYGCNLDALYDCLTSISEQTRLILESFSALPAFGTGFRRVFADAEKNNPNLKIELR